MQDNFQLLEYKCNPGERPTQTAHHITIADEHKLSSTVKRHAMLRQKWNGGWIEVRLEIHQSNENTRIFSIDRDPEITSIATTLEDLQSLVGHVIKAYFSDQRQGALALIHVAQACLLPPEIFEQLEIMASRAIERERKQMRDAVIEVRADAAERIKRLEENFKALEEDYESASNERAQLRRERHELVDKVDRQQAKIDDLRQQLNLMRKNYQQELNLRTKAETLLAQVNGKLMITSLSDEEKVAKLKEILGQ